MLLCKSESDAGAGRMPRSRSCQHGHSNRDPCPQGTPPVWDAFVLTVFLRPRQRVRVAGWFARRWRGAEGHRVPPVLCRPPSRRPQEGSLGPRHRALREGFTRPRGDSSQGAAGRVGGSVQQPCRRPCPRRGPRGTYCHSGPVAATSFREELHEPCVRSPEGHPRALAVPRGGGSPGRVVAEAARAPSPVRPGPAALTT